jgi:hypothetical protein
MVLEETRIRTAVLFLSVNVHHLADIIQILSENLLHLFQLDLLGIHVLEFILIILIIYDLFVQKRYLFIILVVFVNRIGLNYFCLLILMR